MAKQATHFLCSECGWSGSKWFGRCPECGQWGTIAEFHEARPSAAARTKIARTRGQATAQTAGSGNAQSAKQGDFDGTDIRMIRTAPLSGVEGLAQPITEVDEQSVQRISTGFEEFDRVLGSGIVPGSVVLVAGEPGIGKSTLLLETAGKVAAANPQYQVLYVSGEESASQVRMRASRIHAIYENLLLASTTDLGTVLGLLESTEPLLTIVDSAQTIISADVDGIAGGSTQVREVASALIDMAKTYDIPVLLVGHVTKDGSIAGPRTLEHLVDVVCQFEGDAQTALRLLRATKNRFGPTDEVGCFDMSGEGIEEVTDPSQIFLSQTGAATSTDSNGQTDASNGGAETTIPETEGTCVTFTVDGHRSLPIEVQSLVTTSALPTPRRAVNGIDSSRLAMLIAVLHRHGRVSVLSNDVYLSTIAGGLAKEPACDLAIALALASAAQHTPIPRNYVALGEISLTGQIRPVPRLEQRLREAARLGFTHALIPARRSGTRVQHVPGITVIEVPTLARALSVLDLHKRRAVRMD